MWADSVDRLCQNLGCSDSTGKGSESNFRGPVVNLREYCKPAFMKRQIQPLINLYVHQNLQLAPNSKTPYEL